MSIIFNPPRPTVTDDMIRAAAAPVAEKLDGNVETIVKAYSHGMDGYDLARELDIYYGWTVRREDIDDLDEVDYGVRQLLKEAQFAWVKTNNIQPPYPIGARVACQTRKDTGVIDGICEYSPAAYTGVIDGICEYSPAAYLVNPDGQTGNMRWVCKFEEVNLLDQEVV